MGTPTEIETEHQNALLLFKFVSYFFPVR